MNYKKLGELLDYEQPNDYIVEDTKYDDNYKTPVLTAGQSFILGYTNEENNIFKAKTNPVIIFDDFTTLSKYVDFDFKVKSSAMKILKAKNGVNIKYVYYLMQTIKFDNQLHKRYWLSEYSKIKVPIPNIETQNAIVKKLDIITKIVFYKKEQLQELNQLIKSQFVEMFGNLEINNKKWKIVNILEVASIDTNMTKDFEKYAELPHIGIENIEKNTGKLINYISVAKSNLTSGKYIFDERHIIYSKIRPNLNKVATPDFKGLCSADSYPILTNEKCNKEYLVFVLRADYFLNYILSYSSRTNIPKVNKEQLSGFDFPLPPISLQNQFADIVKQIDKQKFAIQKSLEQIQELQESLMNKYFGE